MKKFVSIRFLSFSLVCLALAMPVPAAQRAAETSGGLGEGTRIVLRLNDYLSTKSNSEGDTFTAEVVVPVYQGEKLIIPKGSIVTGSVPRVLRPGRFRGKAELHLMFESIRVARRGPLALSASLASVDTEGNSGTKAEGSIEGEGSKGRDAGQVAKPGAAGAGIGALVGGGKGAAIGAGIGAAVGLATIFSTRGKDLELRRGTQLEIVLDRALVVPLEAELTGGHNR
jgi:hypothetical protein